MRLNNTLKMTTSTSESSSIMNFVDRNSVRFRSHFQLILIHSRARERNENNDREWKPNHRQTVSERENRWKIRNNNNIRFSRAASFKRVVSIGFQFIITIIHLLGFRFANLQYFSFDYISYETNLSFTLPPCVSKFVFLLYFSPLFSLEMLFDSDRLSKVPIHYADRKSMSVSLSFYFLFLCVSVTTVLYAIAVDARTYANFMQLNEFFASRTDARRTNNMCIFRVSETPKRKKLHPLRSNDPNWLFIHCVATKQPEHIAVIRSVVRSCISEVLCLSCFFTIIISFRRERDEIKMNE